MAYPNAFALKNSPFNTFLFSEVGLELNGSALTVLSTLARLGEDPWSQALRWAALPKPAIIDDLANRIRQMPLCPQALLDARSTAARLIMLLPLQNGSLPLGTGKLMNWSTMPKQVRLTIFYCALAFCMAVNIILMSAHPNSEAVPTNQSAVPQATSAGAHSP